MSKKKAIAAIVLLSLGIIMVPGGFIINDFIQNLTYNSVDEGLRGIKDQGVPLVIEETLNLGPTALAINFDLTLELGIDYAMPLVNASILMNQVNTVESLTFPTIPTQTLFFDQVNMTMPIFGYTNFSGAAGNPMLDFPPLMGISEFINQDLNFTIFNASTAEDIWGGVARLKFGVNKTGWWGDRLPGIYEDTYRRVGDVDWPPVDISDSTATVDTNQDRGFGVMEMMALIEDASEEQILNMSGPNGYDLYNPEDTFEYNGENYTKLEIFYHYFNDYFNLEALKLIISDINRAGSPIQTLYPQYTPTDWNEYDTDYYDLALYSFVEQWAKCNNFDNGFEFHNAVPSVPTGIYGLEPAGPGNSSGIPMQAALQLWNKSNEFSLMNINGINKWYNASTDTDAYNELLAEFSQYPGYAFENGIYGAADLGFNETDMDLILDWLWGNGSKGWNQGSFYEDTLPKLLTDEIAFRILLEQWTYGTIRGIELYPGGFPLPLGSNIIYGFELGFQGPGQHVIPAEMSIETALALWDTTSEYSLTTKSGINKWFAAVSGDSDAYSILQSEFDLSEYDMYLLLNWLPDFQKNVMPALAQYQYSLPTDSITLSNILEVAFVGLGAVCIGLGAMGMGGVIATRKTETYTPKKKLDPFELGSKK